MNYTIVPTSELSSVDFSQVSESGFTLRYSLDSSKFILKFQGEQPSFLIGKTNYTRSEMLTIVKGSEWTQTVEE